MKKITAIVFALVLVFCLLPGSAFAVGVLPQPDSYDYGYGSLPQPDSFGGSDYSDGGWSQAGNNVKDDYTLSYGITAPFISSEPSDMNGAIGNVPAALQVSAYSPDGGELHYQWYAANTGSTGTMTAIPGAYSDTYTPPQTAGTAYYCVGVYTVIGNMRSAETQSRLVAVTYSGIEILSAPSRTSYTKGESVSLKGLVVRVYDANGSYWDSYDGSGLSLYPSRLDSTGRVAVELSYGMSGATFYVNVSAAASSGSGKTGTDGTPADGTDSGEHVHDYGEWEITKEATCLSTGIRSRTCSECGDVQTEVIPKGDHSWDDGVITKQPTATTNGARLYTCTVCKANKSEIIPAGTDTSAASTLDSLQIDQGGASASNNNVTAPVTPTTPSGTVGGNDVGANVNNSSDNGTVNKSTDSTGWWLIPVSALLLVGCGSGAYYLMKRKSGE